MSKHSPGPWKVWHSGFTGAPFVLYAGAVEPHLDDKGHLVCAPGSYIGSVNIDRMRCDGLHGVIEEGHANARLLAAAPDLLAALEDMAESLAACGFSSRGAWAAIAKAKGETA